MNINYTAGSCEIIWLYFTLYSFAVVNLKKLSRRLYAWCLKLIAASRRNFLSLNIERRVRNAFHKRTIFLWRIRFVVNTVLLTRFNKRYHSVRLAIILECLMTVTTCNDNLTISIEWRFSSIIENFHVIIEISISNNLILSYVEFQLYLIQRYIIFV